MRRLWRTISNSSHAPLLERISLFGMQTRKGRAMNITASERERILLCRQTSPEMTVRELCHYYMIHPAHAVELLGEPAETVTAPARKRRVDKHKAGEQYALAHVFEHITAQQLADSIGVSLPTAYKVIDDRPDYFRKIKRGMWECRDAKADRKAEKGN